MKKGNNVEFNDNRMDDIRKDGTNSVIYLELPNNQFRVHTVVIGEDGDIHNYITVNGDELHEL